MRSNATSVAVRGNASSGPITVTTRPSDIDRHDWILAELARLAAKPSVALLSPRRGFVDAWKPKFNLIASASEARRKKLGNPYAPRRGVNERDFLWSYCTQIAVARAVVSALGDHPSSGITGIEIMLDQKSLKQEQRGAVEMLPTLIPRRLTAAIAAAAEGMHPGSAVWVEWVRESNLPAVPVAVQWYTQSPDGSPQPMSLANALAQEMLREHQRGGVPDRPLTRKLIAAGYPWFLYDVTHIIEQPLRDEALIRWAEDMEVLVGQPTQQG